MQVSNKAIFSHNIFDLPKQNIGQSFPDFLTETYNAFLNQIKKFDGDIKKELVKVAPIIDRQITSINKAVRSYYNGFPAEAYYELSQTLNDLERNNLLPIQEHQITNERSAFYRARVSDNKSLKKEDLFHIPFQIREKVATQRYSIPGFPCLYLADSVFVCWEELGRPPIASLHVSRFDLSKSNFKLLYFNVGASDIRKRCFPNRKPEGFLINQLIAYISYWPILAACSISVNKPSEVFKPEYIIPQLVLQWIVSTKSLDGIVYRSNRVNISYHSSGTFNNIVIPVKKTTGMGFCNVLKSKVELTNPVSWQLLEIAGKPMQAVNIQIEDLRRAMYIELIEGERAVYSETTFGIIEIKLKQMKTSYII